MSASSNSNVACYFGGALKKCDWIALLIDGGKGKEFTTLLMRASGKHAAVDAKNGSKQEKTGEAPTEAGLPFVAVPVQLPDVSEAVDAVQNQGALATMASQLEGSDAQRRSESSETGPSIFTGDLRGIGAEKTQISGEEEFKKLESNDAPLKDRSEVDQFSPPNLEESKESVATAPAAPAKADATFGDVGKSQEGSETSPASTPLRIPATVLSPESNTPLAPLNESSTTSLQQALFSGRDDDRSRQTAEASGKAAVPPVPSGAISHPAAETAEQTDPLKEGGRGNRALAPSPRKVNVVPSEVRHLQNLAGIEAAVKTEAAGAAPNASVLKGGDHAETSARLPETLHDEAAIAKPAIALQALRLTEHLAGPEMHFVWRPEEGGQVQVNASVHHKAEVQISVSADRPDAAAALRAELPSLDSRLQEHALRLGEWKVVVTGQDAACGSDLLSQHRGQREWNATPVLPQQGASDVAGGEIEVQPWFSTDGAGRVSVLA